MIKLAVLLSNTRNCNNLIEKKLKNYKSSKYQKTKTI